MKAISTGNIYRIYDDSLKSYDRLPAQAYTIRFNQMSGFYLEKHMGIEVGECKIYGSHNKKVEKVLSSFEEFKRSLGVILSGEKGIGKSLFAKCLSIKAIEKGMPVLIVDSYMPGIASFIESIEQEVLVLFDEFDKTFKENEDDISPQATMLSLFDGISPGKKLFVITCNGLRRGLNEYIVNRPGRFHYHFRFGYPSATEIREYLQDKVKEEYWSEIDSVIIFASKVDLNYDCLRAISFELNKGESFNDALQDLNILNLKEEAYDLTIYFKDGKRLRNKNHHLDMFGSDDSEIEVSFNDAPRIHSQCIDVSFSPANIQYNTTAGVGVVFGEDLTITYDDEWLDDDGKELLNNIKSKEVSHMEIRKEACRNIRYAV